MKIWSALRKQVGELLRYFAQDAHAEARAGERVAEHHRARQAEFEAEATHLVLEQLAQRLDELELHVLGQPADVVVRLDDVRLAGLRARGLDHVGIDRALRQPAHAFELVRFLVEHLDEHPADGLALALGIGLAAQRREEAILGVDADHLTPMFSARVCMTWSPSSARSRPWSTNTQTSCSPIARCSSAATTDESTPPDSPSRTWSRAHLLAHARDGVGDDVARLPARLAGADLAHEALDHPCALQRVRHFGVELHRVIAARLVGHGRERRIRRGSYGHEAGRDLLDAVAVAHPHVEHGAPRGSR